MKHNYTKANLEKTLKSIEDLLILHEKQKINLIEMQKQLIRISRAIKSEFWIDIKKWKKTPLKEKIKILREEKCVRFQSSGSEYQDVNDFPYIARFQWEKDRKKLIKEGEIIK